jgi:HAD superfamily hydrolase (TIGR01509 family)
VVRAGAAPTELTAFDGVLFDLDGVLTDTATLHEAAWASVFADVFAAVLRGSPTRTAIAPFTETDYRRLVDGEQRMDGARHVLADRRLTMPDGVESGGAGVETVWGIANAKDATYQQLLAADGPHPFPSSLALVRALHDAGMRVGVVSASRSCREVLTLAGIADCFDAVVDGAAATAMALPGKPSPATYLEGAIRLGLSPARTVVVEDAVAGVAAGRAGGFGLVIGVDRHGSTAELLAAGAQIVVTDLSEVGVGRMPGTTGMVTLPGDDGLGATAGAEGDTETLGTLANGYVGCRAARTWVTADGTHYPGTYLAGVYDRRASVVAGLPVEREAVVNAPNWLPLTFSVDGGPWLGDAGLTVSDHHVRLDLRRGLLLRSWRVVDGDGRSSLLSERRLVSMAEPHVAALEIDLTAENWSGELRFRAGIDAAVTNSQTDESKLLGGQHLDNAVMGEDGPSSGWLVVRTLQSHVTIAEAFRVSLTSGTTLTNTARIDASSIERIVTTHLLSGGRARVEKVVALFTSQDRAISEPLLAARARIAAAPGFETLLEAHCAAWARLWERTAMEIDLSPLTARVAGARLGSPQVASSTVDLVHLQLFHLLQVAAPHVTELDVGIPARGLAGEGYLGHIFWDEMFVFPVLNFRFPEVARALLLYRHRRLGSARSAARAAEHSGAMFPWQSGSDGRDESPGTLYNPRSGQWIPDRSFRERHVGLAIAFELWQHWETTGDSDFFFSSGAEVFLETARFFTSLASFDRTSERWRIRAVMGPDEFHDAYSDREDGGVDDNAYTNVMTAWLLGRAVELVGLIRETHRDDVLERIDLRSSEVAHWEELTRTLFVPFHDGVISQFDGYGSLLPIDLDAYRAKYGNIGRLDLILDAEGDHVRRYQVAKQADVLMLFYLFSADELRNVLGKLGFALPPASIVETVRYYSSRSVDGSSLSAVVHAWVQARADRSGSWEQFGRALSTDASDTQGGSTAEGLHLGAMAGVVDLLQRCYTGLEVRDGALWLDPALPDEVERLRFALSYRGHWVEITVDHHHIEVRAAAGPALPAVLVLRGRRRILEAGQSISAPVKDGS